jgi:hypothetical protein
MDNKTELDYSNIIEKAKLGELELLATIKTERITATTTDLGILFN